MLPWEGIVPDFHLGKVLLGEHKSSRTTNLKKAADFRFRKRWRGYIVFSFATRTCSHTYHIPLKQIPLTKALVNAPQQELKMCYQADVWNSLPC
mmetsp:Transcript_9108/g.11876  ORF Transcript_9108/g.11876 Transcript_9108/m.11876 type:complete len:94 (+) Transcript_9108:261-542(+)